MRLRLAACGAFAAFVLFAGESRAFEFGTPEQAHPFRSPQNFAFELRFTPYKPQVDDEPGLTSRPFEQTFGTNPRLGIGLELDWQTYRIPHVGTIGPGLGVGLVTMSRNVETISGRASRDETALTIYPFTAVAVLRGDVLWRELGFPIVPYAKAGLGLGLWRASNTLGTSEANGVKGKGASWGTDIALGASFVLDSIDRGASVNMDNATGINSTSVFFEYYWLSLDGLAQSHALYVGTATWAMGLAFEF